MTDILADTVFHLCRFKHIRPGPAYLAGLIDGDGCIFIRKIQNGYQSGISLAQSRTNILQIIRYHFGGSITSSLNRNNQLEDKFNEDNFYHKHTKRNQYNLVIRSNEYMVILEYIKDHFQIKANKIHNLYEFSKFVDRPGFAEEKERLYHVHENKMPSLDFAMPSMSIAYIQGLFDAEGCFYIDQKNIHKYYISITQKQNPLILGQIQAFFGFGKIDKANTVYRVTGKSDCLDFIRQVKAELIVKYNQAIAFESFLHTPDLTKKQEMYTICNAEKHQIEHFTEINQQDTGKEGYEETRHWRNIKDKICREIRLKQVYIDKSKKMQGGGNHNFGKQKTAETRQKMAVSIRAAKNGISDEMILKVRTFLSEGKLNCDISNQLHLNRHIVSQVKNGKIVCRTETKSDKTSYSKEEQNVRKRIITLDGIMRTIDKIIEGLSLSEILKILHTLERNEKTTIDIIRNIKRAMQKNKMPFYEFEVLHEQYLEYARYIANYASTFNKV